MCESAGSRKGRDRRRCPLDTQRFSALRQYQCRGVEFVRAVWIAWSLGAPWIADGARDAQRLFDLSVVSPHFPPVERPIRAIAELGTSLEPLWPKAQRHHGEVDGGTTHRSPGVVRAELQRVLAIHDALLGPVE